MQRKITFGSVLIGCVLMVYSIYIPHIAPMIIGLCLVIIPIIAIIPSFLKEEKESKLKLRTDYNKVVDLIKEDNLKEALKKSEKIYQPTLKLYLQGVIVGKTLKGDEFDELKLDVK